MNDVMKKRLIGVAVLVVIGVLAPLLLSKCMHSGGDDSGRGSMRVYNVDPNGSAKSASSDTAADVDGATGAGPADDQTDNQDSAQAQKDKSANRHHPEALSPQSESSDESFSTPPVKGSDGANDTQSAESNTRDEPQPASNNSPSRTSESNNRADNDQPRSSSASAGQAQRNDSASGWVVQIAAFGELDSARDLANQLSGQYRASYAKAVVNGKTWYRVNVGPFASENAARSTADSLRRQGRKPLVRHLP